MNALNRRAIPDGMTFGIWRAHDGWELRCLDWPAATAARGSLLFLGGRGDFAEKYLEAMAHWHDRGWSIAGFDWRGQGGSGRYLADRTIGHIPDFDPLLGDLAAFVDEWTGTAPSPHAIVAHSMGGQLALRLLARPGPPVDGAVLLAPMVGIRPLPTRAAAIVAAAAAFCGRSERRIWSRDPGDRGGRMTSCPIRREDKLWWKSTRPDIASGPPSWGWLGAACASIGRLRQRDLASIRVPTLVLASKLDPVIDLAAVRRTAARLPNAQLRLFEGKGHELLREADGVRIPVLRAIDAFLAPLAAPAIHSVTVRADRRAQHSAAVEGA